jgi:acyl CoA:acetate/3-ketoacid CoA transferase
MSPDAVAEQIADGSVITVSGLVGSLVPDALLRAVRALFDRTRHPLGLTAVCPVAVGDIYDIPGLDHLAHPDLLTAVVSGSYVYGRRPANGLEPELTRLILEDRIQAYNFPIGVIFGALREIAAHRPGLITRVGIGTFQDPRVRGGRLNETSRPAYVSVVSLGDEEYLWYRLPRPDVALLRATTADEYGNVSAEHEVVDSGLLVQATAAHNSGGRVFVQVARLVEGGSIPARHVVIPGVLVDGIVVAEQEQQATGVAYDPFLSGELRAPEGTTAPHLEPHERLILHKAAQRLRYGDLVILGFGIPSKLADLDDLPDVVRLTVEHGAIGGRPSGGLQFGGARNAEALVDTPSYFDFIDGGGCDVACLGFAEVDARGSVNVSRLPSALPGSGGFTNITASTKRLLFCGSFTAGGVQVEVEGSRVTIAREGRVKKFVQRPRELTFAAGMQPGQEVVFVTDRCILERVEDSLVVTEVYDGVDFDRDIAAQAEFPLVLRG